MDYSKLELYHHGIKGQKWGILRFQNKDGSLTPAGRIRYGVGNAVQSAKGKASGKASSSTEKTAAIKTSTSKSVTKASEKQNSTNKSVKDMSDDDLMKAINRLRMEQSYKELLAKQTPQKNSRAKKFVADMADKTARTVTEKVINEMADRVAKSLKPKTEDRVTNYILKDLDKVGDKSLNDAVERAKRMVTYQNTMDALKDPEFRRKMATKK